MKRTAPPLLLAAALAACATAPAPEGAPAPEVNEEMRVTAAELTRLLDDDDGLVVLHVGRDRSSYDAGHVPGARFLALGAIVVEQDGIPNELPPVAQLDSVFESVGVSDDSRVVLYGDLGGLAAARAFFTLDYLGHPRVALLDGGLDSWRAGGHPLSTEAPSVAPGRFTPRPQPERLVTAGWVREHLNDPDVVLVDARPPAEYAGTAPDDPVARPGHIPGAQNLFWRTLLVSDEDPQLRSDDVLRGLFEGAGAEMGKTIVSYCRTGVQASFDYYVARYLGYDDVRMYDGSYLEWSRRDELPVER